MPKNYTAIFYLLILSLVTINSFLWSGIAKAANIPKEAIRLRIIANSNSTTDQTIKHQIRDAVKALLDTKTGTITTKDDAYEVISTAIPEIELIVQQTLQASNKQVPYSISLEKSKFPTKMYGNYLYPAGKYETLLINIGEGTGDNWWCVLYPPLCFLDFNSNTVRNTSKQDASNIENKTTKINNKPKVKFALLKLFKNN